MLTLLQGDDTSANNKTIRLLLPDKEVGSGYSIEFVFLGLSRSGTYVPGGEITFDYTAAETGKFPLGISYGRMYLKKNGLRESITANLPVCVTDCIERVNMATNTINLSVKINTAVPHVDKQPLTTKSTPAEVKALANALLAAVNSTDPS